MLSMHVASAGLIQGAAMRPAVQARATAQMYDISNPFERNDEGAMADTNGCFPGQSKGYKSPNRPDQSWTIMQEEQKMMEKLKENPKFSVTGKPGNWFRS